MTANSISPGDITRISQQTNPSRSQTDAASLNSDFTFFLKLMTTQLQHQDPTEPMDTNALTDQITQFTQVEQQVRTNSHLEKLLAAQNQSQLATAVSFIGSEVETAGNTGEKLAGRAIFSYNLDKGAVATEIVITDGYGRAVFKGQGTNIEGRNLVVWDGRNSFNGNLEPDGVYTISVASKDSAGKAVKSDARAVGIVTAVESAPDGTVLLTIADRNVRFNEVLAVRSPTFVNIPGPGDGGDDGDDTGGTDTAGGSGSGSDEDAV